MNKGKFLLKNRTVPLFDMRQIIYLFLIESLLLVNSNAEPLIGSKVEKAVANEFPFIASLQFYPSNIHFCMGTLIARKYVLTAAHCIDDKEQHEVRVVFGNVNLHRTTRSYEINTWLTYNQWAENRNVITEPSSCCDIAIITLRENVYGRNIRHVFLSNLNKMQMQGKYGVIAGWGVTSTCRLARSLRKATVSILDDRECERRMRLIANKEILTTPKILCTASNPFVITGDGDSGAPLLDKSYNLLGVTIGECPPVTLAWGNFTNTFLRQYQVNVHANIDYYRAFINEFTN